MTDVNIATNDVKMNPEGNVATAPAPGPGAAEAQPSATAAVDDAMKVFAGNLAFATTEDELKSIFSEAGTVAQVQIIKRGTRSLGYGFVTYSTEAEAQKAVTLLNKREIAGREINVEGAKPQTEAQLSGEDGERKKSGGAKRSRGRGRGRGGRGAGSSRRPRNDEGEDDLADPLEDGEAGEQGAPSNGQSKSSRRRKAKKESTAGSNGTAGEGGDAAKKPARQPRKPKGPPEGEPSKTLVFVSNLSFGLDDESLKVAFEGFQIKRANVILQRFGRKSGKSKGFGFVDFETESEQQRALREMQGKTVDGRDLQLKIAIQGDDRKQDEEEEDPEKVTKAEAAADADPAPAA